MRSFVGFCVLGFLSATGWAAPQGFQDPGLVDSLKLGNIDINELISTNKEVKLVYRSFFKNIAASDYIDVIEDHDNYRNIFPKLKDSRRTDTLSRGSHYKYQLTIVTGGIFGITLKPEIEQVITNASSAADESFVNDTIINYKREITSGLMGTRIVPYENGLLISHTFNIKMGSMSLPANQRRDLKNEVESIIRDLRTELKAEP